MVKMRVRFTECLLVIGAISVAYLAAEAAFSLVGLCYVPLRLHQYLPQDVRIFAQSSKTGVVPRDPVLLLGDSYAQGLGDWLFRADANRNGPFHSAHVIKTLSGRDVVTLGASGAGSPEAMAAFPAVAYASSKRAWYLRLPAPHVVIAYFYEGNDLDDNMRFLARQVADVDAVDINKRIDRAIAAYPSVFLVHPHWWRHFPLLLFSKHLLQRFLAEQIAAQSAVELEPGSVATTTTTDQPNIVEVAGQAIDFPPNLQSPGMHLTELELERATVVYERSLAFLRDLLPNTPVLVAYLPSPLSTYRLLSPMVSVQLYFDNRDTRYPKARVAEYSDTVCHLIRAATVGQNAGFLDLRPAFRAAAARDVLHGPVDFKHYNQKGMKLLGQIVAQRIDSPLIQDPC
jgi:hypothetical protein